jgi:hypothetical protein
MWELKRFKYIEDEDEGTYGLALTGCRIPVFSGKPGYGITIPGKRQQGSEII